MGWILISGCGLAADADDPRAELTPERDPFDWTGLAVSDTPIGAHVALDGRRAMVFATSLDCPDCWDAVANVASFAKAGEVDTLVALTFGNPAQIAAFRSDFGWTYPVVPIATVRLAAITPVLPRAYLLEGDTVRAVLDTPIPSPQTFRLHR